MALAYRLDTPADKIAAALGADRGKDVWQGGPIAPGDFAPVVLRGKGQSRILIPRLWGVPPPPRGQHRVTTVRNCESPFWIGTLRHTEYRCLVPATAFRSARTWFAVPGQPVFALAGIWRDSEVPSFAVLTTANDGFYPDHAVTTMPLVLRPADCHTWLCADWQTAQMLVAPGRETVRAISPSSCSPSSCRT